MENTITFETAKLAKLKGFNWCSYTYFDFKGDSCYHITSENTNKSEETIYTRPTQSLLQKWLRENYDLDIWAKPFMVTGKKQYLGFINFNPNRGDKNHITHKIYEEALEMALQTALKIIE